MDRSDHLELQGKYLFLYLIGQWRTCSLSCIWIFSYLIPLGAFVLQREKHKNNCTISTIAKTLVKVKSSMYTSDVDPTKYTQHGSNKHSFSHWQSPPHSCRSSPWVEILYCHVWAGKTPNMTGSFHVLMRILYFQFEKEKDFLSQLACPITTAVWITRKTKKWLMRKSTKATKYFL